MNGRAEADLSSLGFTDTEAGLYCALLRSGPATAYRLAKRVGKAPANAYQALAVLTQKGAVVSDEGEPKIYRAAEPAQLLSGLGGEFEARLAAVGRSLAGLAPPVPDDRIYQLDGAAAVLERAKALISSAVQVVLFDLFPAPFAVLRPALAAAASRGAIVAGLVYEDGVDVEEVDARRATASAFALERWPGVHLSLVSDASEHLVALLSPDLRSVRRAFWSDSAYLSCLQHSGLSAEISLAYPVSKQSSARVLSLLQLQPPGLHALVGPRPIPVSCPDQE